MNSYKFVLKYDNNGDARDASKTMRAFMLQEGNPNMAASLRYNGPTVEFVCEGNVSAVSFAGQLELFGAVYTVTPVGDSAPLPTLYLYEA